MSHSMLGVLYVAVLWRLRGESMDRLISEQKVLNILRDYYRAWFLNDEKFMCAINMIKAIPPTESKTGHWKRNETIRLTYCSECGFGQHIDEFRTYNYCPNCGACMKDCRTLDEFIEDSKESEDKCKNCEYYRNPDYTRCHECEAESEE